jgi:hypothetical protein
MSTETYTNGSDIKNTDAFSYQNFVVTSIKDIIDEQCRMAKELAEIRGLLEKPKRKEVEPKKKFEKDSEEYGLAEYFVQNLCVLNDVFNKKYSKMSYSQQVNHIQKWAQDIDKLMRIDGQKYGDIKMVIDWIYNDPFWSTVVLSTANLRKNFPKLYPKAERKFRVEENMPTASMRELE